MVVKDEVLMKYLPDNPTPKVYNRKYLFNVSALFT